MRCEMCKEENAEASGMRCGLYKVCNPCVTKSIHARMWLLGLGKDDIILSQTN